MGRTATTTNVFIATLLCLASLCAASCSGGGTSENDLPAQEQRAAAFEEMMRGAIMEGYFTTERKSTGGLTPERYEIEKAVPLAGGLWTVHARIQYGEHDVTVPVPVRVVWAGDTPVITLTDVGVPGLGTFSARVLFYRGQYSGTWSHGETRGWQFGTIRHEKAP